MSIEEKESIKSVTEEQVQDPTKESSQEKPEAQEGAFNPETGEFNWDCPCLGGMAQGPCGEDFKAAFSCFVLSEAEPKGYDCVEKFQAMQDCFRRHPDHYADEIDDEEEEVVTASSPNEKNSDFSSWVSSWF